MTRVLFLLLLCCPVVTFGQNSSREEKTAAHSGLVLVDVDSSGKVTAAKLLESTGVHEYDEAALKAFRQWRFKPGTAPHVKIPITFTSPGGGY